MGDGLTGAGLGVSTTFGCTFGGGSLIFGGSVTLVTGVGRWAREISIDANGRSIC
jgi:hypothetical protein